MSSGEHRARVPAETEGEAVPAKSKNASEDAGGRTVNAVIYKRNITTQEQELSRANLGESWGQEGEAGGGGRAGKK